MNFIHSGSSSHNVLYLRLQKLYNFLNIRLHAFPRQHVFRHLKSAFLTVHIIPVIYVFTIFFTEIRYLHGSEIIQHRHRLHKYAVTEILGYLLHTHAHQDFAINSLVMLFSIPAKFQPVVIQVLSIFYESRNACIQTSDILPVQIDQAVKMCTVGNCPTICTYLQLIPIRLVTLRVSLYPSVKWF